MHQYILHGDRKENKVALTFDDGPNPEITTQILEILEQFGVRATFFIIGEFAEKFPDLVRLIDEKGHLVGNHSYSHSNDFKRCQKVLEDILKKPIKFFRLPGIDFNLNGDTLDPKFNIAFDVDSWDHLPITSDKIYTNVCYNVRNGSIVDFHDGSENVSEWGTRPLEMKKALPEIIVELKERFILSRIDEMKLDTTTEPFQTNLPD